MSAKLVSVVMATYNGEMYLREQVDSIINQTYRPIEIIIVDDCSSDSTFDILKEYERRHDFIRVYKNEINKGVSSTFSSGVAKSFGSYIAFSDQDDFWLPNKLDKLVNDIGNNLLICSDFISVDSQLNVIGDQYNKSMNKLPRQCFSDYLIGNNIIGCCTMISRELVTLSMPIPDRFYMHDYYFAIWASFYNSIKKIPDSLVYYRQHNNNVLGASKQTYDQFINRSKEHYESLESLLLKDIFRNNEDIKLMVSYRKSIYTGDFLGIKNVFKLLRFKHGYKLIILFIITRGTGSYRISKFLFTQLRRFV